MTKKQLEELIADMPDNAEISIDITGIGNDNIYDGYILLDDDYADYDEKLNAITLQLK